MVSVRSRIENLEAALKRLEEAIDIFSRVSETDRLYDTCRDSLIQRFEFCFDLFWKSLKDYLEKSCGISVASPRSVFREAFGQGFLQDNQYKILESMIGDRNDASLRYDQAMAESIAKNISLYCDVMEDIFQKLDTKTL